MVALEEKELDISYCDTINRKETIESVLLKVHALCALKPY
jgi:hypothetical protein